MQLRNHKPGGLATQKTRPISRPSMCRSPRALTVYERSFECGGVRPEIWNPLRGEFRLALRLSKVGDERLEVYSSCSVNPFPPWRAAGRHPNLRRRCRLREGSCRYNFTKLGVSIPVGAASRGVPTPEATHRFLQKIASGNSYQTDAFSVVIFFSWNKFASINSKKDIVL